MPPIHAMSFPHPTCLHLCHITLRTTPTGGRGFQIMALYALIITCSGFNIRLLCFRCRSTVSDGGERRLVPALPLPAPGHGPLWPEGGGRLVLQSLPLVLPAGPWAESDRRPATRSRYTSGQLLYCYKLCLMMRLTELNLLSFSVALI